MHGVRGEDAHRSVGVEELQEDDHAQIVRPLDDGAHAREGGRAQPAVVRKRRRVARVHLAARVVIVGRVVAARRAALRVTSAGHTLARATLFNINHNNVPRIDFGKRVFPGHRVKKGGNNVRAMMAAAGYDAH